jgi:hypothetical protein
VQGKEASNPSRAICKQLAGQGLKLTQESSACSLSMARSAVMNLPSDILALIFEQNGLDNLSGLKERCACSLVCRCALNCRCGDVLHNPAANPPKS